MLFWKQREKQNKRIYADAAAATPLSLSSRNELVRLLNLFGNAGALHQEGVEAKKELEAARKKIAESIGAHADEMVFTSSGTEGNNLAIAGTIRQLLRERGAVHAITSAIEHQSVLEPLRALKREGLALTELPVDSEGLVSPKALAEAITEKTVFVSIQLVNSEIGTIEPIKELAKQIRAERGRRSPFRSPSEALTTRTSSPSSTLPIYFHTDASQAPVWVKIGVEQLGIDLMTLDGQKVLGPKGVGVLYIKRGTTIEPILWGGKQEWGLRGGTENTPLAGAFAVALAEAQSGVEERIKEITLIRDFCFDEIKKRIPEVLLNGSSGDTRVANNLNLSIPNLEAEMAVIALDTLGVAASTRSACNIGEEERSHVIKALGVAPELAGTAIRITLLPDITRAQATRIADSLAEVAHRYKNMA